LEWLRLTVTVELLETISKSLLTGGTYGLSAAMLTGPAFALLLAVKTDRLSFILMAAAGFISLAVFQFVARTLIVTLESLVKSTPTRLSSRAFLECFALATLILGIIVLGTCIYYSIQFESLELLYSGIGSFVFLEFTACIALHPQFLGISTEPNVSAGEEAIGVVSFFIKLLVRFIPIGFGLGAILGAIGFLIASSLMITGSERALNAMKFAVASTVALLSSGLLPFLGYIFLVFGYIQIDALRAILIIPSKLDRLAETSGSRTSE